MFTFTAFEMNTEGQEIYLNRYTYIYSSDEKGLKSTYIIDDKKMIKGLNGFTSNAKVFLR